MGYSLAYWLLFIWPRAKPLEVAADSSFNSDSKSPFAMISAGTLARMSPLQDAIAWSVADSSGSGQGCGLGARPADMVVFRVDLAPGCSYFVPMSIEADLSLDAK